MMVRNFKIPWLLGKIAKCMMRLHYRHELKPFAEKMGHDREDVRQVCVIAVQRVFDEAWPAHASGAGANPLVWHDLDDGTAWAMTINGLRYQATNLGWCLGSGALHYADGLEAAKAAAQADYEARSFADRDPKDAVQTTSSSA